MRTELDNETGDGRAIDFTVTLDPAEATLTETPFGVTVTLEGLGTGGAPGAPALPTTVLRVAVPEGTWPRELTIVEESWEPLTDSGVLVSPAQHARPGVRASADGREGSAKDRDESPKDHAGTPEACHCAADCSCRRPERAPIDPGLPAPPFVPPDPDAYESAARDPRPVASAVTIESTGGVRIAVIEFAPVRLSPKCALELCTQARISLAYAEKPAEDDRDAALRELREIVGEDFDERRVIQQPEPAPATEAEARRLRDVVRLEVLNPALIDIHDRIDVRWPSFDLPCDYLIITDDWLWDAAAITPTAHRPGIIREFERLAQAKRARGISARVVSISDIVGGRWGDFRPGARDLQEVIRTFLKSVRTRWGVQWLLLGGDVGLVPVRHAAGAVLGGVTVGTEAKPANGKSYWTGTRLRIHAAQLGDWWFNSTDNILVRADNGRLIPYDAAGTAGSASPGWCFTTSDTYATRSATPTDFIRVEGPGSLLRTDLQFIYAWNSIPTDFYYASLDSWVILQARKRIGPFVFTVPWVYRPDHDWDAAGNGVYGQHRLDGTDIDGVILRCDLSVGRAPVETAAQAATFVDKTIAYERASWGLVFDRDWPRRMVLAASDWGGRTLVWPTGASTPADNQFVSQPGQSRALLKLAKAPADFSFDLVARVSDTDRRELPFKTSTSPSTRGWYYATSATDATPSVVTIRILGLVFRIPIPSQWVIVHGTAAERSPAAYELNPSGQDGSMADQEKLRTQISTDLPGIDRFSRYYEDERDLGLFARLAAPVQYLTAAALRAGLENAPHLVSLSGHGNQSGVATLSTGMASVLTNGQPGFIGYADSCLTNGFDANDSMSEALLLNNNGGVAYVGNTRFSWIGVGDDFQRAFFRRLRSTRHLGLLNDSRLSVYGTTGYWKAYERWQVFSLNLLGDPELRVYRMALPPLVFEYGLDLSRVRLFVAQTPPVGPPVPGTKVPVAGALVHVRHGEEELALHTDDEGYVELPEHFGRHEVELTASFGEHPVAQEVLTLR